MVVYPEFGIKQKIESRVNESIFLKEKQNIAIACLASV